MVSWHTYINSHPPMHARYVEYQILVPTNTLPMQGKAARHDEEGVAAPRYIPALVPPQEDLDNLIAAGADAAPDIIHARGVPADPTLDPASFGRKDYSLIFFEIGFCTDRGCHENITEKAGMYHTLFCALRRYWGRV